MARQITITDSGYNLQFTFVNPETGDSTTSSIPKSKIRLNLASPYVTVVHGDESDQYFAMLYTDVVGSYASALALFVALLAMLNNIPFAGFYASYGTFVDADLVDGIATFYLTKTATGGSNIYGEFIYDPAGIPATVATAPGSPAPPTLTKIWDFTGPIPAGDWFWVLLTA